MPRCLTTELSAGLSPAIVFEAVFKPLYSKMCFCTGGGRSCLLIPLPLSPGEFVLRDHVGVLRPCLKDGREEVPLRLVSHPLGLCRDLLHRNLSASIPIFPTPGAKSQIHFLLTCLIFCGSSAPEPLASRFLGLLQVGSSERSQCFSC